MPASYLADDFQAPRANRVRTFVATTASVTYDLGTSWTKTYVTFSAEGGPVRVRFDETSGVSVENVSGTGNVGVRMEQGINYSWHIMRDSRYVAMLAVSGTSLVSAYVSAPDERARDVP